MEHAFPSTKFTFGSVQKMFLIFTILEKATKKKLFSCDAHARNESFGIIFQVSFLSKCIDMGLIITAHPSSEHMDYVCFKFSLPLLQTERVKARSTYDLGMANMVNTRHRNTCTYVACTYYAYLVSKVNLPAQHLF